MSNSDLSRRRAELLARLAAERTNILYQLRGLDAYGLSGRLLPDGWAPKDYLPHIGYWDAVYSRRIELVLDGRRREVESLEPDERDALNAQAHEQFKNASVGEAIAIALKERNGFMASLSKVPDDLLFRRIQLRPGWRTSIFTWTRWRYFHDGDHAAELVQWREFLGEGAFYQTPPTKLLLRPMLQSSRQEFMLLAALIPAAERDNRPILGDWTLKDVFGHITVYERLAATALQQLAAGQSPQFEHTIRKFDTFNEAQVVARHDAPWPKVLEEFRIVRSAVVRLLESVTDEVLFETFEAPWGTPLNGYLYLLGLVAHEQEHADFLRDTYHMRALPKRLSNYRPT